MTIYTPKEVARILKLSPDAVRQMFRSYPGVIRIHGEAHPLRITLRIPHDVLQRFLRERQVA